MEEATDFIEEDSKAYEQKIPRLISSLEEIRNDNNETLGKF